ncbi:hypothetical protein ACKI1K_44375, partial [Streptomyces scabiei]|uniref:hypothetical protein n=1 Tax=Streptomyces scabiei TaxID=1930 RepID=UPI0038F61F74
ADLVLNSLPIFPVATPEDFLALLKAIAASGAAKDHPTPVERFVATHPAVARSNEGAATPVSYATEQYNGVDAFYFVSAAGKRQAFRWVAAPE